MVAMRQFLESETRTEAAFGAAAFTGGAAIMAMGYSAIFAQTAVGVGGALYGGITGYQEAGIGGALLGITGGFIGGYMGAMGGVTAVDTFKNPKNLSIAARLWGSLKDMVGSLFDPPLLDSSHISTPSNGCTVPGCSTMPMPRR